MDETDKAKLALLDAPVSPMQEQEQHSGTEATPYCDKVMGLCHARVEMIAAEVAAMSSAGPADRDGHFATLCELIEKGFECIGKCIDHINVPPEIKQRRDDCHRNAASAEHEPSPGKSDVIASEAASTDASGNKEAKKAKEGNEGALTPAAAAPMLPPAIKMGTTTAGASTTAASTAAATVAHSEADAKGEAEESAKEEKEMLKPEAEEKAKKEAALKEVDEKDKEKKASQAEEMAIAKAEDRAAKKEAEEKTNTDEDQRVKPEAEADEKTGEAERPSDVDAAEESESGEEAAPGLQAEGASGAKPDETGAVGDSEHQVDSEPATPP